MKKMDILGIVTSIVFFSFNISFASLPHAPHDLAHSVSCESCHSDVLPATDRSAICETCHDGVIAPAAATHSSTVINGNYTNWGQECLDCHDPHLQTQLISFADPAFYLATGTITNGTIVDNGNGTSSFAYTSASYKPGWDPVADNADWGAKTNTDRGLILVVTKLVDTTEVPDQTFEITSATGTTVTVNGLLASTLGGRSFGVMYGQLLKSEINTPSSGIRAVKLFDPNGDFVDEVGLPPEGICQVCHTQTAYWKSDGSGPLHPNDGNQKCAECHLHSEGFKPSCEICHGYPPAYENGNPKANSHLAHDAYNCSYCHFGTTNNGYTITDPTKHDNGAYDLQAGNGENFSYVFDASGGTCNNISCHGGTNATWGDPTTVSCLACHLVAQDNGDGVPVGGRRAVVGEFPAGNAHAHYGAVLDDNSCQVCHDQATHSDGNVDLFDPDGGSNYSFVQKEDLTSDPDLSNFCMNCHDANGAARLAAPLNPFGNGNTPPNTAERFSGTLQWNEWYGDFCFGSEGSNRPVNSHHDISDSDQTFSGAKLECLNCHGAHTSALSQPTADPFNTDSAWNGTVNGFCLSCHNGGANPLDPGFPSGVAGPTFFTPLTPPPPDPPINIPGTACDNDGDGQADPGYVYDCADNCVWEDNTVNWQGDGYCDDGTWGVDLRCPTFNGDLDDCICQGNDCSTLGGIDSCAYSGQPWEIDFKWTYAAHGQDSKRSWPGYAQTPQAPSYELECTVCHDPHGSYSGSNTAGNPYMIRDNVDGTGFVDDGRRGNLWGEPWTYGTAGEVIISNSGSGPDLVPLCSKCHADWQNADPTNHECTACLTCHSHGGAFGGVDWVGPPEHTLCPAP